MPDELKLLQGTLDVLILKALSFGPRHGYGVARWIRATTDDALQIEDGALYHALSRLRRKRWVDATWGVTEANRRARFYELTSAGHRQLSGESERWAAYAAAVSRVLQATEG